jgi:hypothetical protein
LGKEIIPMIDSKSVLSVEGMAIHLLHKLIGISGIVAFHEGKTTELRK